jgi:putative transposase
MEGGMDREELKRLTKEEISRRIREGVKAVIEQVLEEEMTEHLAAGYRERTESRRGERKAHLLMEILALSGRVRSLDLVEVNPILDEKNRTALMMVGLPCP